MQSPPTRNDWYPSLSQSPSSLVANLAWSLCNLPLMVTGGCHQGGNQSWYFLVEQVLPWEVEGKRAVPEDRGMTLSSLSLGPDHDHYGWEQKSSLFSIQTPGFYLKAPPIPVLPYSSYYDPIPDVLSSDHLICKIIVNK